MERINLVKLLQSFGFYCFVGILIVFIVIIILCNSLPSCIRVKNNPSINATQCCFNKNLMGKEYLCIDESVDVIPDECFKGLEKLKRIDFKGDISYLGRNAFSECVELEEINFYGKLNYYSPEVFKIVDKLKRIYFQDITIIQQNSFAELSNLEYVTIKSGLELIEDGAFKNCENLKSLRIPLPTPVIEDKYVNDSVLVEFIYSDYHTINFGKMVFWNNSCIKSLIIPDNCKILSDWMFTFCSNLEYVEIPDSVSKINKHCFSACLNIKEINYLGDFSNFASIYPTYKVELNKECIIRTSDCPNGKTVSEWIVENERYNKNDGK